MKIKAGKIISAAVNGSDSYEPVHDDVEFDALVEILGGKTSHAKRQVNRFWIIGLAVSLLLLVSLLSTFRVTETAPSRFTATVAKLSDLGNNHHPVKQKQGFVELSPGDDIKVSLESDLHKYFSILRVVNGSAELFESTSEPTCQYQSGLMAVSRKSVTWWFIASQIDIASSIESSLNSFEAVTFGEQAKAILSRELNRQGLENFSLEWRRYENE